MNEDPDDHTRALRDRFAAAAAKLGPPISPSVAEIQRLGQRRRHRRLGMATAVTSAARIPCPMTSQRKTPAQSSAMGSM